MNEMIAFCGSDCHKCKAFLATRDDDDKKRAEIVQLWSKQYHVDIKPEDINCEGCKSASGRYFTYCNVCEIRKCGTKRDVENCAYCNDYPCKILEKFFEIAPNNRILLEAIRS